MSLPTVDILGKYWICWPKKLSNSVIQNMPDNMTCCSQLTCPLFLLYMAKSGMKLCCIGTLWCVQVMKTVSDTLIYIKVQFWSKQWLSNSNRVTALAALDLDGWSCYDTSAEMWPTHDSSHNIVDTVMSAQFQTTLLVSWQHKRTCWWYFQLR